MTNNSNGGNSASKNHQLPEIVLQGVQAARLKELAEFEDDEQFLSLSVFVCVEAMSSAPEFVESYAEFLHRASVIHDLITCERQTMNSKQIANPKKNNDG